MKTSEKFSKDIIKIFFYKGIGLIYVLHDLLNVQYILKLLLYLKAKVS
jgi:hypothetical protein